MINISYYNCKPLNLKNATNDEEKPIDLNVVKLNNRLDFETYKSIFNETKTIFFGPFTNRYPWEVLSYSTVSFSCIGDDDEGTIDELCEKFDKPETWDSIAGLANKKPSPLNPEIELISLCNKRAPK